MSFRNGDAVTIEPGFNQGLTFGRVTDADRTRPDPVYKVAVKIDANQAETREERVTGIRILKCHPHQLSPV